MGEEVERGPQILDAHQELVRHVEEGAARIRLLSVITLIVAAVLAVSYVYQIALPFTGTTIVTVNLSDSANIVAEFVVMLLALVWVYVGVSDLRFSWRIQNEIRVARSKEREIEKRVG